MSILVDTSRYWPYSGGKLWCHMASDQPGEKGLAELHAMADKIGMKREWFQNRRYLPHYDLQPTKRRLAVKNGAVEVDGRELVRRCSTAPYLNRLERATRQPAEMGKEMIR